MRYALTETWERFTCCGNANSRRHVTVLGLDEPDKGPGDDDGTIPPPARHPDAVPDTPFGHGTVGHRLYAATTA
jgi:hypothetical protein